MTLASLSADSRTRIAYSDPSSGDSSDAERKSDEIAEDSPALLATKITMPLWRGRIASKLPSGAISNWLPNVAPSTSTTSVNKIYIMEHAGSYYILAKSREKNMYTECVLDPKDLKKALKKVLYIVGSATIIAHDSGRTSLHLDLSLLKTAHKWYSREIRKSIPEGLEISLERIPKKIKEDIIEIHHK